MSESKGKRGGKREGAGRPSGSKNTLGYGEVKAVKASKWRVPEGVPESVASLADEALDVITNVMRGGVHWQEAGPRLKAATTIRTEVCGPVAQKLQHEGADGEPLAISINLGPKK